MANVNASTAVNDDHTISSSRTVTEVSSASPMPAPNMLQQAHHYVSLKLTASNFLFWKAQLVPFLRGQNLYGFVDGSHPCPPEFITSTATDQAGSSAAPAPRVFNTAYAQWIQQDQSILSMLISSMAEEVLYLAIGHDTSRDVWRAVESAFGSCSRSRSLGLLSRLYDLRQGESSPADYLGRAKVLVEQLAQAGRPVGLDEQNLHILRGLRPEYRALVSSLTTKDEPLTIPQMADLLNAHQYVTQDDVVPSAMVAPPAAALYAQSMQSGRSSHDGGRGRGRQHRGQRGRGGRGGRGGVRCQLCDAPGHSALTCYRRFVDPAASSVAFGGMQQVSRHSGSGGQQPRMSQGGQQFGNNSSSPGYDFNSGFNSGFNQSQQFGPRAHLANQTQVDDFASAPFSNVWLPDTGANAHATPQLDDLREVEPYSGGESLRVGDGSAHRPGSS